MRCIRPLSSLTLASLVLTAVVPGAFAQATPFKDVPPNSSMYSAVAYLRDKGIMKGYEDGTFRPTQKVNRAEAVKIVLAPFVTQEQLDNAPVPVHTDVTKEDWFAPYVSLGVSKFGILDGPPKAATFQAGNPVLRVQFLKMFFLANKIDVNGNYSEIKLPLSADVQNTSEWYYPSIRMAVATSMMMVAQDGTMTPAKELTRGDIALLLYRYYMYKDARRTQALLDETETEIVNVLQQLDKKEISQAEYASARALIAARGALSSKPDESIVKGAVKIAEGFQLLVRAYKAGVDGKLTDVLQLTGDAWHLAEKAKEYSPNLATVSAQMQTIAKNMADEARGLER